MLIRKLRLQEKQFISYLLSIAKDSDFILPSLDSINVSDMEDGGMGSLLFHSPNVDNSGPRMFGKAVSEYSFNDQDGVLVTATLNVDTNREIFELDIWKVNFDRLIKLPNTFDEIK